MIRYSKQAKQANFKRLAAARTDAVLDKLRILSNCANPQLYEYSEKEVQKIFKAIEWQTEVAKMRFYRKKRGKFNF